MVSADVSLGDRKPAFFAVITASVFNRSRVDRASRSSRITVKQPAKLRPVGLRAARHFAEHVFASGSGQSLQVATPVARACVKVERAGRETRMPKFVEVLPWVATNKDALLALGAFLAPVTSIIAAAVSYRAVVTGPRFKCA